jgi:LysM repeat protein
MAGSSPFGNIPSEKKATLVIKKKSGDVKLPCHFNPEKYTVSREVMWARQPVIGKNVPPSEFMGGGASKTTLTLLFDTSTESSPKDVRDYTRKIWDATRIDEDNKNQVTNKGEPPRVIFIWGKSWSFEAIIHSLSEEFILFNEDGIPIRSNITVGLTQIVDDTSFGKQNPTSGGTPGKVYTVREGDRLDLIAAQNYGKATHWRHIAEQNNIDDPRKLKPGQRLILPPLS